MNNHKQLLKDRYQIHSVLGQGGMGKVYKATDLMTQNTVAIKVNFVQRGPSAEKRIERIKREYYFMTQIEHPLIIKAFDFFLLNERYFIVMEYIDGIVLSDLIKNKPGCITTKQQVDIAMQIALGVATLHRAGIIHRDIKPSNIMLVGKEYQVKLLDLGVAKDTTKKLFHLTRTGTILGTANYMSPEQLYGESSENSDVFSVGVLLYQFFCWLPNSPFFAGSDVATMDKIAHRNLQPLSKVIDVETKVQPIYEEISLILEKCLVKKSQNRLSSCEVLYKKLFKIASHYKGRQEVNYLANYQSRRNIYQREPFFVWLKRQRLIFAATMVIFVTATITLFVFGRETTEMKSMRYFNKANSLHQKKKYKSANNYYKEAIKLENKNVLFHTKYGENLFKLGQFTQAIAILNFAVRYDKKNAEAYFFRGLCWMALNDHINAISNLQKAIHLNPQKSTYHERCGFAYSMLETFEKSIVYFDKAIALDPNNDIAYNNRGRVYYFLRDYQRAISDYHKALEINPKQGILYNNLASIYTVLAKQEGLNSGSPKVRYYLEKSIEQYERSLKFVSKDHEVYTNIAISYMTLKNYQRAMRYFTRAIIYKKDHLDAYIGREISFRRLGNLEAAKKDRDAIERLKKQKNN